MATFGVYGQSELVPLQAFAAGLVLRGHTVRWRDHNAWSGETEKFDAIVINGVRAHGRELATHYMKKGRPVVVIDHGYMKRVNVLADYHGDGFFQVGMGGLGWVPDKAPDVERFARLNVKLKTREPRPLRRALIAGQVAFDASHHMTEEALVTAYRRYAQQLGEAGLEVTFRGHPLARGVDPGLKPDGTRSLDEALADADVVASINSNAGLDGLIAGVPAITLLPCHYTALSYRWPVTPAVIQPPDRGRLTSFLERLAWAQWTTKEMREGLPQAYLAELGAIP